MFPLVIQSFLTRGFQIVLFRWQVLLGWSRLFVSQRMKIYLILKLIEKFKFCILHNTCWILFIVIRKFKVLWLEKHFFQISGYLPQLEITELPIINIFNDDWFSKQFCSRNLLYQPGYQFLKLESCDVSIKR